MTIDWTALGAWLELIGLVVIVGGGMLVAVVIFCYAFVGMLVVAAWLILRTFERICRIRDGLP
jgi:hypothetical protein